MIASGGRQAHALISATDVCRVVRAILLLVAADFPFDERDVIGLDVAGYDEADRRFVGYSGREGERQVVDVVFRAVLHEEVVFYFRTLVAACRFHGLYPRLAAIRAYRARHVEYQRARRYGEAVVCAVVCHFDEGVGGGNVDEVPRVKRVYAIIG